MAQRTRRLRPERLVLVPSAWAWIFGGVVVALAVTAVVVPARHPLAWAVAAAVLAAAIDNPVQAVARHIRRGLALVLVGVPLIALVGAIAYGVVSDLDRQVERLQRDIPRAARELERSSRFGELAREIDASGLADDFAARLDRPSEDVATEARGQASSWFIVGILTIFAVAWGPRLSEAAARQITDEEDRARIQRQVGDAFSRAQWYLDLALVKATVIGFGAWLLYLAVDTPAPTALALGAGVGSLVPGLGVLLGASPAAVLTALLVDARSGVLILVAAVVVQSLHTVLLRRFAHPRLYVGPAVVVLGFLVGRAVYGLGGAVFGTALAMFGLALVDAIGRDMPPDEEPEDVAADGAAPAPAPAPVSPAPSPAPTRS